MFQYSNIWILKRLAEMGVRIEDLLMTYESRIRIHVEQNVALWHFSISGQLSKIIEKVQKISTYIILGKHASVDYHFNLATLNLEPLYDRRENLSKTFARKVIKHPVHKNMFTWNEGRKTREGRKVIVPHAKTKRYERSSVPSLARIINSL